jgi:hypothetical protein
LRCLAQRQPLVAQFGVADHHRAKSLDLKKAAMLFIRENKSKSTAAKRETP